MYNMSFVSLRWTFSNFECSDDKARGIVKNWLLKHDLGKDYIMCCECKDKYGKDTAPHLHLNAYTNKEVKKDTVQRWFRVYLRDIYEYEVKGNKDYALSIKTQPDDEDRWWRYILKEEGAKIKSSESKKQFIKDNMHLAIDERKRTIELNNKHLQKYLDKSSIKGKMYQSLKSAEVTTHREFVVGAIQFYLGKSMTPPFTKLDDMFIEYQILVGLMSVDNWYKLKYPHMS